MIDRRRRYAGLGVAVALVLCVACGRSGSDTLANLSDRLSGAPGARGRSVAPAWIDAAEQAHEAAEERRGDDLASAEYEMTARLLFEAAVLRADQIELDRQRQSLAKEAEGAWGAAHRDGALLDERIRRDWDRSAASLARCS